MEVTETCAVSIAFAWGTLVKLVFRHHRLAPLQPVFIQAHRKGLLLFTLAARNQHHRHCQCRQDRASGHRATSSTGGAAHSDHFPPVTENDKGMRNREEREDLHEAANGASCS